MFMPFDETAPTADVVTKYDREHTMLYLCLLDRRQRGQEWQKTVRAFFAIDPKTEPDRARHVYDRHLARAEILMSDPHFAMMWRMASFL